MSKYVNPIKLAKYKKARLENKSITQSLLEAGQARSTAEHKNNRNLGLVRVGEQEIAREINKQDLVRKAFRKLEERLISDKCSDEISAASNILKFTEGEVVNNKISYTAEEEKELNDARNRLGLCPSEN